MNSNNINNFKMLKFELSVPLCLRSDSYRNGGYYSMLCHKDTKTQSFSKIFCINIMNCFHLFMM